MRRALDPALSTIILVLGAATSLVSQTGVWFVATCVVMAGVNFGRELRAGRRERRELSAFNGLISEVLDTGCALMNEIDQNIGCSLWLPERRSKMRCRYVSSSKANELESLPPVPILSPECVCIAYRQRRVVFTQAMPYEHASQMMWHLALPVVDVDDQVKSLGVLRVDGTQEMSPERLNSTTLEKKARMVATQLSHLLSTVDRVY